MEEEENRPLSPIFPRKEFNWRSKLSKRNEKNKIRVNLSEKFSSDELPSPSTSSSTSAESLPSTSQQATLEKTLLEKIANEDISNFKLPDKPNSPQSTNVISNFQTASGQQIEVPKNQNVLKLFEDILNPSHDNILNAHKNKFSFLEKNANNQNVRTPETHFNKSSESWTEDDCAFANFTIIENRVVDKTKCELNEETDFKGFDNSDILKTRMELESFTNKFSNILQPNNKKRLRNNLDEGCNLIVQDFKRPKLNELRQLQDGKNKENFQQTKVQCNIVEKKTISGFASASGKQMKISEDARKIYKIFNKDDLKDLLQAKNANFSQCSEENFEQPISAFASASITQQRIEKKVEKPIGGFASASGTKLAINEEARKKMDNIFNDPDFQQVSSRKNNSFASSSGNTSKFSSILNNPDFQQIASTSYISRSVSSNVSSSESQSNSASFNNFNKAICQKTLFKANRPFTNESPIKFSKNIPICSTPLRNSNNRHEFLLDSTITPIKNNVLEGKVNNLPNLVVLNRDSDNIDKIILNLQNERKALEKRLKVITERENAFVNSKNLLKNSDAEHRKRRNGILFEKKQQNGRVNLLNGLSINVSNKTINEITPTTAENINFKCSDCTELLSTEDGAKIIPNADNLIGLPEIQLGFKTMPGVEPKLIPFGWIRNHFKWIVWKLASYEHFTVNFRQCLNVENVIQQLKYRYDREIDRAERSSLRKIFELDDVPQKRLILCISNLFQMDNNRFEIELTDGWYAIRTTIDDVLNSQVLKRKIQIGMKLIISSAELLNCNGCHPLEANRDDDGKIRLKINGNSTRRAVWHAKLGYQKVAAPFPILLKSINPRGGLIGCIKVYIARVYPIKYLEKQGSVNVWRDQKAEDLRAQTWQNERLKKIEQVQAEMEHTQQLNDKPSINLNSISREEIKNMTCAKTLFELAKYSNDPESVQMCLSESQISAIKNYQQELAMKHREEMQMEIERSMNEDEFSSKRDVVAVLPLYLVDALEPNPRTGVRFDLWKPLDTHLYTLKENTVFSIYNILPKQSGALSSMTRTNFRQLHSEDLTKFTKFNRITFPISKFFDDEYLNCFVDFKEFDTVGLIVKVSTNLYNQILWLTDSSGRLLSIKIFQEPKECAIFNSLKVGQIVAVLNILFSSKNDIVEAIGSLGTVISSNPQQFSLQKAIATFKEELSTVDIDKLLKRCLEYVKKSTATSFVMEEDEDQEMAMSLVDIEQMFC